MSVDPFTLVHQLLASELRASVGVQRAIKSYEKNIVDFSKRLPILDKLSTSDLPEVQLQVRGVNPRFIWNSSSVEIVANYGLFLSTGDMRVDELLFPVSWALHCAVGKMLFGNVFNQLQYNGQTFVADVNILESTAGFSDPTLNRGIVGWSLLSGIQVNMQFPRTTLIEFSEGDIQ